jgi:hypothetical protein
MVRLAFANGFKLHTFYSGLIGYKGPIWNRDIDRHPSNELILLLHTQTGQPIQRLRQLTLSSFDGILFDSLSVVGNNAWVLPVGVFHRVRRRFGMQYCPLCLKSDLIPFYRKTWRLALHVICPKHQCVMEAHCPSCTAPIAYHRHGVGRERQIFEEALLHCSHCNFDLRHTVPSNFIWRDEDSWAQLLKIINICDGDQWDCGALTPASSVPFFRGLHILLSLLNGRHSQRIVPGLAAGMGVETPVLRKARHSEFEFLRVQDRLQLLLMVAWLLVDWPQRFVEVCQAGRMTRSRVADDVDSLPFWLADVTNEFLDNRLYLPSDREIEEAASFLQRKGQEVTALALREIFGLGHDGAIKAWKVWREKNR